VLGAGGLTFGHKPIEVPGNLFKLKQKRRGGIRSAFAFLTSASYRNDVAVNAANTSVAVHHCTLLHAKFPIYRQFVHVDFEYVNPSAFSAHVQFHHLLRLLISALCGLENKETIARS
jgi:hypothetical protein